MLPFTPEAYLSLLADYDRAFLLVRYVAFVLAVAAVVLSARPLRAGDRLVVAIIAAFWLWTGGVFHFLYFARINFVAPAFAALFVLQGLLLIWTGVIRGRLELSFERGRRRLAGGILMGFVLAVHLFLSLSIGYEWHEVARLGVAPMPTVIFTLGMLLWTRRAPWHLLVIPLLWCLIGATYGWFLGIYEDLSLLAAALVVLIFRGADGRLHRSDAETQRRA